MKAMIYGRVVKPEDKPFIKKLFQVLEKHDFDIRVYESYAEALREGEIEGKYGIVVDENEIAKFEPEVVISLGGDGTILNAMNAIKLQEIPILGINLGRLGFLANVDKNKIEESLLQLKNGDFTTEKRSLLEFNSNKDLFGDHPFAMNDFTIHKRDNASMILIHCYVNDELLNSYWADGLIVSTPTGSTSYSLSVGGPIITPTCGNFVISPVAPHNLTARPVVVGDDVEIKIKVEGRSENYLITLDSRNATITESDYIVIKKAKHVAKFVVLKDYTFFKTIHKKLNWGTDKRN